MTAIRVISTTIIQAASHSSDLTQKIELNPWDLHFFAVGSIQKGLLFRNPKEKSALIQHLQRSLSTVLSFFPLLTGRLTIVEYGDDTASVSIICNNAGAEFVHAILDNVSCSDILEPIYIPRIVHSFFPLNGVTSYEYTSKPLLGVQVTELVDGIFICCSFSHCVADGTSFWQFFNSWAEISRGLDKISKPPAFERFFLHGVEPPIRIPFTKETKMNSGFASKVPKERIFHFTKEKNAELKAKANAEANTNRISSLQAVLSHVWRSAIRNQNLDLQEEVNFTIVIGVRQRMNNMQTAESYFGNAILPGTVSMKAGELMEGGTGNAALEMSKVIALYTEENIMCDYERWVRNPKVLLRSPVISNALGASNSPRFDIYGNDFGWGKPVAVRSGAANKRSGKLTVYSGAEEGSIDIDMCFSDEILEAMGNDPQFMDAVSI